MYKKRSNNLHKEIHKFKVLHGGIIHNIYPNNFKKIPKVSKNIHVVVTTNYTTFPVLNEFNDYKNNITFTPIFLDSFSCWIDKIRPVLNFIQTIKEPYVLYLDASDTIIVDNISNPQKILDTYNCKILFNAEDGYSLPGHSCDKKEWMYDGYYEANGGKLKVNNTNMQRLLSKTNAAPYVRSLNAGVYLAEKEFLIQTLQKILDLMLDDPAKGYPFGESDDQILWQYLQAQYENGEIEIDYNNLYFMWGGDRHFNYPKTHWEHFNYFNNVNKNYSKSEKHNE